MRLRLNSLRMRMALILATVLLIPFTYTVVQSVHAYGTERARLLETLERTASLISTYQSDFFEEARQRLLDLAERPEIEAASGYACSAALIDARDRSLRYGTFAVSDAAGEVACSSAPAMLGAELGDRRWFHHVRDGEPFIVSEVVEGRDGERRTVIAAVPLRRGDNFRGALSVSIDLSLLDAHMRELSLPENASVFLIDQRGEPLGPMSPATGESLAWAADAEADGVDRPTVVTSADQVERRYVTAEVKETPLRVVVGLPAPDDWSWIERNLIAGLFGPFLMLALAVGAIWIAADFLVNRHIGALARTARAYSSGDFDARPKVGGAPLELRELGETFGRMAEQIRAREAELTASLEHKDLLLREIHHRVKNNLQIISSLINLRARAIATPAAREALHEARTRVTALALVYRFLYEHNELDVVDLDLLVRELSDLLGETAGPGDGRIELKVAAEAVQIATARAISVALWLTEAATNALGHAFPDQRRGTVTITLRHAADDQVELVVEDDGIGIPPELTRADQAHGGGTLGLTLITMLAKQVGGEAQIESHGGTRAALTFPRQNGPATGGTFATR